MWASLRKYNLSNVSAKFLENFYSHNEKMNSLFDNLLNVGYNIAEYEASISSHLRQFNCVSCYLCTVVEY